MLSKLLLFNKAPYSRYHVCCIIVLLSLVIFGITYISQSLLTNYSTQNVVNTVKSTNTTTNQSLDVDEMEAEKDSIARRKRVKKVCMRVNARNVLEDKRYLRQKMNLYDHLVVNEKHKVIYCYIPKVACTNLKRIFVAMNGQDTNIQQMDGLTAHSRENLIFLNDKKFSEKQRTYMLDNFYKFVIVRDPLERILSAYKSKWEGMTMRVIEPWLFKIGEKIISRYRYNDTNRNLTGDIVTFSEYIHHIIDTPPYDLNEHWMPYNDLCRPCDVHYDFIGSIETLIRDVAHVIRHIKVNETKYVIAETPKDALTRTKKSTASFYKDIPEEHFRRLAKMFKLDHELFGYSLPELGNLDERFAPKGARKSAKIGTYQQDAIF